MKQLDILIITLLVVSPLILAITQLILNQRKLKNAILNQTIAA